MLILNYCSVPLLKVVPILSTTGRHMYVFFIEQGYVSSSLLCLIYAFYVLFIMLKRNSKFVYFSQLYTFWKCNLITICSFNKVELT